MDSCCLCKIRNIYRSIISFETQLQQKLGLNMNEAMLLCVLSDGETRLAGEIAEELGLTRSNASKVIASLEKQMYIRRQACKEDSRCQRFHITKKGCEILNRVHCDDIKIPEALEQYAQ
ncbi:MAG: MarR family winged helix-turn-helix transcriptional regulator [Prevotella sp.]|jgi:DNA-binding MarR family transcriptional regulator